MQAKELKESITGYRVSQYDQHGYQMIDVDLIVDSWQRPGVRVSWQANGDHSYYGGRLKIDGTDPLVMVAVLKLLCSLKGLRYDRTLPNTLMSFGAMSPQQLIDALEEVNIQECQHHDAAGEYYARDSWPTKASYRMMNPGDRHPYLKHIFADSEAEALTEALTFITKENRYFDWLEHRTLEFLASPQDWKEAPQLAPEVVAAIA